jgi:isopentenyldiphosphate isomerase
MAGAGAVWSGEGLSQMDLMHKDECICVDEADAIVGHDSKVACHRFVPENPTGILHRAFSVFLFNPQGELLLQQRATDKITVPGARTLRSPPL